MASYYFAASIVAAGFFAIWTWLVLGGDAIPAFDLACAHHWHDWSEAHTGPWRFMLFVTDLGGVAGMTILTLMAVLWQSSLGHGRYALAWLGIIIGAALVNQGIKEVFQRPRPPRELRNRAVMEENLSYPSGHSMNCVVNYGLLAYTLLLSQSCRWRRGAIIAGAAIIVMGIGFSRMYLRAHWFSDVVGGFALGAAWLLLCLGLLEWRSAVQGGAQGGGLESNGNGTS
ncbi:MAG: phosphatase PAP2 family protein [Planctomycetes bacterium]|nr:phosphatase PAP2 family protein [Planctomycetota bacterium]